MAPKRKGIIATSSSGAGPSTPARADGRVPMDGAGDVAREHPRHSGNRSQAGGIVRVRDDEPRAAESGGRAVLLAGGAAASTTPRLAPAPRPSQVARDEQHRDAGAPGTAAERAMCATHRTNQAGVRAQTPVQAACDRETATEPLLTWLEAGAHCGLHRSRRRLRQQNRWRACSCSSTSPLLRRSSTSGEPPSKALSASPKRRAAPNGTLTPAS